MSALVSAVMDIVGTVGEILADHTLTFTSPVANNTLRMTDGTALGLELADDANPGDAVISVRGTGGVLISGTLRSNTTLTVNGEVLTCQEETSAEFGILKVEVSSAVTGTHSAGAVISLDRVTISNIPASTASVRKAFLDSQTSKLPEFGFVIARKLLPLRPRDGWSVVAVNLITNEVSRGRVSQVTGGTGNVFVWVGRTR